MKKPIFGPCDSYELEPFSYQWAWDMSREQENNNWAPEEIQVHGDVADYNDPDLPLEYKHVFESIMAQLTTFDMERGDDAAETFLQIVQPAELKHFLKRLVWDEALHTRSYRYCIENLGVPIAGPNNIYNRWKQVKVMHKRVRMAQEISDSLLDIYHKNADPDKLYSAFFRSAFFWFLIFEGVWFVINLSGPVQALARAGRFRNTAEQFQYILRDEHQHIAYGVKLLKELIAQYPSVLNDETIQQIHKDIEYAVKLEDDFISYVLSEGNVIGYSESDHRETVRYLVNMRLRSIGLPNHYLDPKPQHKFPWMSEQIELKKEKNFFETRVTEYKTGGALSFDDVDSGMPISVMDE